MQRDACAMSDEGYCWCDANTEPMLNKVVSSGPCSGVMCVLPRAAFKRMRGRAPKGRKACQSDDLPAK